MAGLTFEQARDAILTRFKTSWDLNTPSLNGGQPVYVEYQNVVPGQSPLSVGHRPWARIRVAHTHSSQTAMGVVGNRVFTRLGQVVVQIFTPAGQQGLVLSDRLGIIAMSIFEGEETSESDIWFRDVTYREIGVDEAWYQANVSGMFEYRTTK